MAAEDQKVCTLAEAMAEEGLVSLERATELIEQIVVALQAAQIRGRTHFHLEPRTILVSEPVEDTPGRGSRTKVIGLAPRTDPLPGPADGTSAATEATPLAIDDPAQQVALAAIAYEMLAGCSPFADDSEASERRPANQLTGSSAPIARPYDPDATPPPVTATPSAARSQRPDRSRPAPLSELVVGVPPGLDEVFRRALSPVPDHRFASLYDLVSTLRAISGDGLGNDGATEIGGDFAPTERSAAPPAHEPLRLSPPTGEAIAWVTSTDEPAGQTPSPAAFATATPPPAARTTPMPEATTPMVVASLPASEKPSRRTQVSFLAAAIIIVAAAVGVMSGSRKKVSAEEPAAVESTAVPIHPVLPPFPRSLPAPQGRPAAPSPPAAEPEVNNDGARSTHRRSRRHAMHRPRAQRR